MSTPFTTRTALWPKCTGAVSFTGEDNDCVVRATANATGVEYQKVHDIFNFYGRKTGKGTVPSVYMKALGHEAFNLELVGTFGTSKAANYDYRKLVMDGKYVKKFGGTTIKKFIQEHPVGKFVCMSNKHAFAIVDGDLVDKFTLLLNTRIILVYKVKS